MQVLLLKAAATALTLVAAAGAALHVSVNVKSAAAPLHPAVVGGATVSAGATGSGSLHLAPSVRSADVQAVTSTYAS